MFSTCTGASKFTLQYLKVATMCTGTSTSIQAYVFVVMHSLTQWLSFCTTLSTDICCIEQELLSGVIVPRIQFSLYPCLDKAYNMMI